MHREAATCCCGSETSNLLDGFKYSILSFFIAHVLQCRNEIVEQRGLGSQKQRGLARHVLLSEVLEIGLDFDRHKQDTSVLKVQTCMECSVSILWAKRPEGHIVNTPMNVSPEAIQIRNQIRELLVSDIDLIHESRPAV